MTLDLSAEERLNLKLQAIREGKTIREFVKELVIKKLEENKRWQTLHPNRY